MDYVVDLRPESPTFLQWCCIPISAKNQRQVLVPERCGHAFVSLDEGALILYLQEGTFNPPHEWDFYWKDELLQIKWDGLVPDLDKNVIVSAKDQKAPSVRERLESVMDVSTLTQNHKQRVLVIGASGQLGTALCKLYKGSVGTRSSTASASYAAPHCYMEYNLETASDEDAQLLLEMVRPTILIICGAFTWVDGCERNPDKAMNVNCHGPARLVKAAQQFASKTSTSSRNMQIVFYSTDYVFDGTKDFSLKYTEEDAVSPMNAYGRSKLQGEQAILKESPSALILRTSVVYGPDPNAKNFVCQMLRHQKQQQGMDTVTKKTLPVDQTGCPTYVVDLAAMTKLLLEKEASGVFNLVGSEAYGRFDFAEKFVPGLSVGITTAEMNLPTPRPLNGSLDNTKVKEFLGDQFQIRGIQEALKDWSPKEEEFMNMRQ
mmetsp:Transcript_16455/g.37976  ORF Transcript_16455/g.37976 Transcript_16455/m.37976 type:complete len:432 (+) Transcript_16455:2334-3629(+)